VAEPIKEIRDLFQTLINLETAFQGYVLGSSSVPPFSNTSIDSLLASGIKAEVMKKVGSNPSHSESSTIDVIFRFDAIKRDLAIRKKSRLDYYKDASTEYSEESVRLKSYSTVHLQTYLGNTKIQQGGGM